jgi:general secretion pathway protein E
MAFPPFGDKRDGSVIRRLSPTLPAVQDDSFPKGLVLADAPKSRLVEVKTQDALDVDIKRVHGIGQTFGGLLFSNEVLESGECIDSIQFHEIINAKIKVDAALNARVAVALLSPHGKDCLLFVDKVMSSPDEVREIAGLVIKNGYTLKSPRSEVQGYFAPSTLIISLSQGHLDGEVAGSRDNLKDPTKNALFSSFVDVVSWAYINNCDDLDFALDSTKPQSQICFKIGGRYVRPSRYLMSTDTMKQILGIAWQQSGGGAGAQFEERTEQQAQIKISLPRSSKIPKGAEVRIRWSGMSNDKGTVVTMRLQRLGESAFIRSLDGAGYLDHHLRIFRRHLNSEGGMVTFSGVVGSGKSTSLAALISMLPPHVKIQSIEDPVELEIINAYQKTVTRDLSSTGSDSAFASAARAIYRSALDVLYLGEIRDCDTGLIARQVVESGHSVYTTIHARDSLGIVERMSSPAIGIPRDVLGSPGILKLLVYQSLLPRNCPHCSMEPDVYASEFDLSGPELNAHQTYWDRIERLYGHDRSKFRMHNERGCIHCRKPELSELNGLHGRTVVCEVVEPDDEMLRLISESKNLELRRYWRSTASERFDDPDMTGKTAMECAIYKAIHGEIDPREIEPRFMDFETVEAMRKGHVGRNSN